MTAVRERPPFAMRRVYAVIPCECYPKTRTTDGGEGPSFIGASAPLVITLGQEGDEVLA